MPRIFITSFIIVAMLCFTIYDGFPSGNRFLSMIIVVFVLLVASSNFFEHHSDSYFRKHVYRNSEYVLHKLHLKYVSPSEPVESLPNESDLYWRI